MKMLIYRNKNQTKGGGVPSIGAGFRNSVICGHKIVACLKC